MSRELQSPERSRTTALAASAAGFWLVLAAIATAAGISRERWLVPLLGESRAHQVGTLLVATAFWVAIAFYVRRTQPRPNEAVLVGAGWLLGAVAFEFGFGHYVDGLPWDRLLADYDLTKGRLLLLLWLTVAMAPSVLARSLQRQHHHASPRDAGESRGAPLLWRK
jgi:hypothetical protein